MAEKRDFTPSMLVHLAGKEVAQSNGLLDNCPFYKGIYDQIPCFSLATSSPGATTEWPQREKTFL